MSRRKARAIERSAVAEVRRSRREVAAVARRRSHSAPKGWSARRAMVAVFGGVAAVGFIAASLGPAIAPQIAEASQDPQLSAYASAADDTQQFTTAKVGTASSLSAVVYAAEVREPEPPPAPEGEPASVPDDGSAPAAPAAPVQPPAYTGGGGPAEWMAAAGIAESDWGYVDFIVSRESGWNPNAVNPSSGACGLVQMYPCNKGGVNSFDPVQNLAWANGYAIGRYGSWAGAHAFWSANHWW